MPYEAFSKEFLTRVSDRIVQQMQRKRLFATGDAASSLEVRGNELLGSDYIYYLDKGRGPGKFPPLANIQEWIREKLGITENTKSIAFLIGRKISEKGTAIYQDNSKGLELDSLIEGVLDEMTDKLPEELVKVDLQKFLA